MGHPAVALEWPPLRPEASLFRAYRYPDDLDAKSAKPKPKVFYRRLNETGLSVALTSEAVYSLFAGAAGMCVLSVNEVAECPDPLAVIQDGQTHAEIQGVPTREENQEKALRIAKYLARVATDCR
jgi:hypothetical protein